MNILPMILTFILILTCLATGFLREVKSYSRIEMALHGYNKMDLTLNNAIAQKQYKNIKDDPSPEKKQTQANNTSKGKYTSRRTFFPALEDSKCNLTPLIEDPGEIRLHPLYEPLAHLLKQLYQNTLLKGEKMEYRLLDALIKKARRFPEMHTLSELFPDDPILKKVYYKMLKGTNQYTKTTGIPPLGEFLTIQKSDKALNISFASLPLLEAFFGEQMSAFILKTEEEKWKETSKYHYFDKQDVTTALTTIPALSTLFTALDPYLNYSKQFHKKTQWGGRDAKTGIAVTKEPTLKETKQ